MDMSAKIEDALCIIDDFDYLDEDQMEKEDYKLYVESIVEVGEKLRPIRDKYSEKIANNVAAHIFADSALEGFERYLEDKYGDDFSDDDFGDENFED